MIGYSQLELIRADPDKSVYQAYSLSNEEPVIIKIYAYFSDAYYNLEIENTCREIMRISNTISAYCPRIRSIHKNKQYCALVMDKVNGITLAEYQRGLHTLSEKAEIINSLIGAVSKLHAAGYVHGDLNSENIMVDENNRIKLIDFDRYDTISNCEKLNLDRCYLKCHIASMIFNTTYDMINIIKSFPDYRMEDIIDYHSNTMMGDKIYKKFRSIPYMLP